MEDLNDKVTDSNLTAAEWSGTRSESQNVVEGTGQTLSAGDQNQWGKAIAAYSSHGDFYTDSGTANAYVLSPAGIKQSIPNYANGSRIIFIPSNSNTAASTVNVGGLGVIDIKLAGGSQDPAIGDIQAGEILELRYLTSPSAHFELNLKGKIKTTVITATDASWTGTPGAKSRKFTAIGAGAGAGGTTGSVSFSALSGGAGAGASAMLTQTTNLDETYNIQIGSGGAGGADGSTDGSDGTATSVTSSTVTINCPGGNASEAMVAATGFNSALGGSESAIATGGDVNTQGDGGSNGLIVDGTGQGSTGTSGGSILGGSVRGRIGNPGEAAQTFGAGGGGAGSGFGDTSTYKGGDGANGVVIVEETF